MIKELLILNSEEDIYYRVGKAVITFGNDEAQIVEIEERNGHYDIIFDDNSIHEVYTQNVIVKKEFPY